MGAIIAFLSSPGGAALVGSLFGFLWRRWNASDRKKARILDLAEQTFEAVENMGPALGLKGSEKWLRFMQMMTDAARAEGSELSGKDVAMLRLEAERRSWLAKSPSAPSKAPPPLPTARAVGELP